MIYRHRTHGKPMDAGLRSRMVENGNGLVMHVMEAGFESGHRPCVVLLHGFPELAYSWRKVMPPLAAAGFHVVAPDQRGYGCSTGWDGNYDGDLAAYSLLNLAEDIQGLVRALGYRSVAAVVGHDFGSPVAAWCALLRPEVFRSVALLSAPFAGAPRASVSGTKGPSSIAEALAALTPPRKHYQAYYSTPQANADMRDCPQGLHAFLRAYFHYKSADWRGNNPFPLKSWAAEELAKMPSYYIMDSRRGMAETAAQHAPSAAEIAACTWLSEDELTVYSEEFSRTGFQGGLQWYRNATNPASIARLGAYSDRAIEVPCCFIAGRSDWGTYQSPGALQAMVAACARFRGIHFVEGAGHWVQQEQPAAVTELLIEFLRGDG
jgi:pimeloyl-ACP methyl ester carboxylesterase